MFERLKLPILLIFSAWMQACTADVYLPVSHPTPLLEEKGDIDAAIYTSTNGTDLHAAYALTRNFGVGTDFNYFYRDFQANSDYQRHKYGEVFFIYFMDLQNSEFAGLDVFGSPRYTNSNSKFKLEFLGGIGLGEGEELRNSAGDGITGVNFAEGSYSKFSLQSNATIEKDFFSVGFSPRLSYVSYNNFMATEESIPPSDKTDGIFWEPAFFMGFSHENIKLQSQIGFSRVLGPQPAFGYERFYMSIGVHINLNVFD